MILSDDTSISVRKLAHGEIEDYREHLTRLDDASRAARFAGPSDDRSIQAHCLRLVAGPIFIVAALNREHVRGACEIEFDPETGTANLAFSVENSWQGRGVGLHLLKESLITCFGIGAEYVSMAAPASNGRIQRLAKRFGFEPDASGKSGWVTRRLDSLAPVMAVA